MGKFDKNSKPHKFFERYLNNDLLEVSKDLTVEYERIASGLMRGISPIDDSKDQFSYTKSISTQKSREYNTFLMYYSWSHEIYSAVTDMVREACEYYDIDYNSEQWMCASWFNINSNDKGSKLNWHDHVSKEVPDMLAFHGYYCVNAEPSETLYDIDGKIKVNKNINNRAILSTVGYQHAQAPWDWDGNRITIAYDIIPLKYFRKNNPFLNEQHFSPLPKIYDRK